MTTIRLPEIPRGEDLEDYVAAFLQCDGFYTEKSLVESGETQVMELDIMAWKPADRPPQHTLFEVKGGNWGFPDVFKVYGWKTYLQPRGVDAAYLIAPRGSRNDATVAYMQDKCRDIGLDLIVHDDYSSLEASLKTFGLTSLTPNMLDHAEWRFSFWLERQMQKVVTNSRKFKKGDQGPAEVYAYQELIRNGFLQARNVRERLASMYQAHFDHPLLAKSVAAELDGGAWDTHTPPSGTHWKDALYQCKHLLVHVAMYHEQRAKLAILKGAVEFALLKKHGALPQETTFKFLGIEVRADFLPSKFHDAVRQLESIDEFEKVPVLWQSFLWKWGGFFLTDHEAEEKSALADEVGMTTKAVDSAMCIYDSLFPISGGWFQEIQGTRILKLFPCQFRGLGVDYRCKRLGENDLGKAFGSLPYEFLLDNLGRWKNSTVNLLKYGTSGASVATA